MHAGYKLSKVISQFEAGKLRVATTGYLWGNVQVVLVDIELIRGVEVCFFDDGKIQSYAVLKPGDSYNFVTNTFALTKTRLTIYTVEPSSRVISHTATRGLSTEITTAKFTIADVYLAVQLIGSGADPSTLALASSTNTTTAAPNPYAAAI